VNKATPQISDQKAAFANVILLFILAALIIVLQAIAAKPHFSRQL
jgi:hypothetical protein